MVERVVSVNVGGVREVPHGKGTVSTGIWKTAAAGPVALGPTGFAGDRQADPRVHGGPHMAAYLYSADDYAWWSDRLGRPLAPGEFGENVTVTGMADGEVCAGDRLRLGGALVEVTAPRTPCFKLGIRMGDKRFVPRFAQAERLGFYVRVLEPGMVAAGDGMERVARGPFDVTMRMLGRLHRHGGTADELRAALASAELLHPRWRAWLESRLEEAVSPGG